MELISYKLWAAFGVFVITWLAAWPPFHHRLTSSKGGTRHVIGEALASGVFLGAGLLHMLAEANQGFTSQDVHYPMAFFIAAVSFLILLFLEHLGLGLSKPETKTANKFIALLTLAILSVHSLLAGVALGVTHYAATAGIILFAIVAHKWAASFALAITLNRTALTFWHSIYLFALFSLMVPIGILFGTTISYGYPERPLLEASFEALAAGTFLYMGTLHGLKRSVMVDRCCNTREFFWVILGFMLMAVIAIWI